jgi:hypothetical protein
VSVSNYFQVSQILDFEIEKGDKRRKLMSRVKNIANEEFSINIIEDDFNINDITTGMKGIVIGKKRGLKFSIHVEVDSIMPPSTVQLRQIHSRSEHLRIDAFISFKYNKISEKEFQIKRKQYVQTMTTDGDSSLLASSRYINDDLEIQQAIPPEIINEIHSIHRKLDFILKIISKPDDDNIFNREPEEINISGSGFKFKSADNLKSGDYLDIKLVLPIASGVIIELIGEVVHVVRSSDKNDASLPDMKDIGVTFAAINADDREFIIRYVFKRQRELLRAESNE